MRNTLAENFDPATARISDLMVAPIHSAPDTDTVYNPMDKFLGLRLRRLPIKRNGHYIGMVSVKDVIKASLREKTKELESLNAVVSRDYHEDWHFTSLAQTREKMENKLSRPSDEIIR